MFDPVTPPSIGIAYGLWKFVRKQMRQMVQSRSDRFLDYDSGHLRKIYAAEKPVSPGLSYVLAADLSGIQQGQDRKSVV